MMMLMPCRDGQIVEARKLKLSKYSRFYQNVNNIFSSTTPQGKPRLNENEITLCISLSLQFTYIRTCSYSHHLCNVKWWVVKIINQVHLHPMNWMELVSHAPRIESNRISQPRPSHRLASGVNYCEWKERVELMAVADIAFALLLYKLKLFVSWWSSVVLFAKTNKQNINYL